MTVSLIAIEHLVQLTGDLANSAGNIVSLDLHSLNALRNVADVLIVDHVFSGECFNLSLSHV